MYIDAVNCDNFLCINNNNVNNDIKLLVIHIT